MIVTLRTLYLMLPCNLFINIFETLMTLQNCNPGVWLSATKTSFYCLPQDGSCNRGIGFTYSKNSSAGNTLFGGRTQEQLAITFMAPLMLKKLGLKLSGQLKMTEEEFVVALYTVLLSGCLTVDEGGPSQQFSVFHGLSQSRQGTSDRNDSNKK